jgi:lipid A disaccharide synthetase
MDHLLCILPFEAAMCKANGVGATFVGHPVLEDAFMNVSVRASWYLNIHELTYLPMCT